MSSFHTTNPATGAKLATYTRMSPDTVTAHIESSAKAFETWRHFSLDQRLVLIKNLTKVLDKHKHECARLLAVEMGKPVTAGLEEIEKCIMLCDYYIEHAPVFLAPQQLSSEYHQSFVLHQPLGAILAVMPWNFPFWQVFRACIPALVSGNTILLKHASNVTASAVKIEALLLEAGLPEHVFQTLLIAHTELKSIIAHPVLRGVTLTGSEAAGREIAAYAGQHIKKVVLELGGNDAAIVMADANIELAARSIVASRLRNTGQVCVSSKRVIADLKIYPDLLQALEQEMRTFVVGDPLDSQTMMGPMAREDLRQTVDKQVKTAVQQGAKCLLGGEKLAGPGFYYPPSLLADVAEDSIVYQEELFGPVISVSVCSDEATAIRLANASQYGLGSSIYSSDLDKATYIASHLMESGLACVNMPVRSDPRLPFGGIKNSGFGRELSKEGLFEFTNIKTVIVHAE